MNSTTSVTDKTACAYRKLRPGAFVRPTAKIDGETTDQIPAFSSGYARKRPVVTADTRAGQDIITPEKGFVAFGANVQIPSGCPRVSVVLSADPWDGDHLIFGWILDATRHWCVTPQ